MVCIFSAQLVAIIGATIRRGLGLGLAAVEGAKKRNQSQGVCM